MANTDQMYTNLPGSYDTEANAAAAAEARRTADLNAQGKQGDRMEDGKYFADLGSGNRYARPEDTKVKRQTLLGGRT